MTTDSWVHVWTAVGVIVVAGIGWIIKEVRSLRLEQTTFNVKMDYLTTNGVIKRQAELEKELAHVNERLASLEAQLASTQ